MEESSDELYLVLWNFKNAKAATPSFYKRVEALGRITGRIKMLQQSAYLVRGFKLATFLAAMARSYGAEIRILKVSSLVIFP